MILHTIVGAVLFFAAPCPDNHGDYGCVYLDEPTPIVYVKPGLSQPMRHFAFFHELGHIAAVQTPGAPIGEGHPNEAFATRFAICHESHGGPAPWAREECGRWF